MELVNQKECLSAMFFTVLEFESLLNFFNYVGKLFANQLWCLQKCLNVFLVNVPASPRTFNYNKCHCWVSSSFIKCCTLTIASPFNYRFISPTKMHRDRLLLNFTRIVALSSVWRDNFYY